MAEEGDQIIVCAKIRSGTLGSGLFLHYRIRAPRENPDFPEGRKDSAKCMFYTELTVTLAAKRALWQNSNIVVRLLIQFSNPSLM